MTLHIIIITPKHILSVSDRLISTSGGLVELDDDRFKHVTLQTDNARAVISFAGFAGILDHNNIVNETTADWLTGVMVDTVKEKQYGINQHLTNIKDRLSEYLKTLRKRLPSGDLRLAIIISGWTRTNAFNCIIDNCIEPDLKWTSKAGELLNVRKFEYEDNKYPDGCYILFPINAWIANKQKELIRLLESKAVLGDVQGMFDASVQIIRAASADPDSKATIGTKCSGIHIPRNEPGFIALHDRVDPKTWTVIPNHVISTSKINMIFQNDEVNRPLSPVKLTYLNTPKEADTLEKRLAFWHRAIEILRLKHNEYGIQASNANLKYTLERFHTWQREYYNPVIEAAQMEMNKVISLLQQQDQENYRIGELAKRILVLKHKNKQDKHWDQFIDLTDFLPFS